MNLEVSLLRSQQPQMVLSLNQMNPLQNLLPYLFKLKFYFKIIFTWTLMLYE